MNFDVFSYRNGLELTENDPKLNQSWIELKESILGIKDNILIDHFMSYGNKRGKSMSANFNELLKFSLIEKGWTKEAKIFNEYPYDSNKAGMKYFRLDFAKKNKNKGISIEVAFNHRGDLSWNLLKPTLATELNHVKKEFQTDIGIIIVPKEEMLDIKKNKFRAFGLDAACGHFELLKKYLKVLNTQLTCPLIIIGLKQPQNFYIDTTIEKHGNKKLGVVIKI